MPQAQELAGCKKQSATQPCRMCHVQQGDDLGDVNYDVRLNARTLWEVREDRNAVSQGLRRQPVDPGLAYTPSALEDVELSFDTTRQLPPEPLHSELIGISLLAVSLLASMLTGKWRNSLSSIILLLAKSLPSPDTT